MTIKDFENELKQKVHKDFSITSHPKIQGMAQVLFRGKYQFAIPDTNIFDERKSDYGVEGFDGRFMVHRSRPEAVAKAKKIIEYMNQSHDNYEAAMGIGQYSKEKLEA